MYSRSMPTRSSLRVSLRLALVAASALVLTFAQPAARAQQVLGGIGTPFKDTSIITKAVADAPAGHKVVLIEFEDLECPACAHAAPIVKTALDNYKIRFDRHDFLIQSHTWSRQGAIIARYLQDKVSPELAEQYRRDVFAAQNQIASPDDLQTFTARWFAAHKLQMPFVIDPNGLFAAEVQADVRMGERLGLNETPTLIVAGPKGWIQVKNVTELYTAIDTVKAQVPAPSTVHGTLKKPSASNLH
jgi:protein-disulfide isomerase